MNSGTTVQEIQRYCRDRIRELDGELKLNYTKPKRCLVVGSKLEEATQFKTVIDQIIMGK